MMVSAQAVRRQLNITTPILAGPALADEPGLTSRHVDCRDYVSDLMGYLNNASGFFPDPYFAWTTHNYNDIRSQSTTLAQGMRDRLRRSGWRGWPYADSANPYLLQTEGGALFPILGAGDQAARMTTAYTNARNDSPSGGQGLAMVTNYLDITSPNPDFDTGLRNTPAFLPRQLYDAWAILPQP